jgi:FkbM family methyltransferase
MFLGVSAIKLLNYFGFGIVRARSRNFDEIIQHAYQIIGKSPKIIFDVGAHNGSSIDRFLKLFGKPQIFAFEPNNDLYIQIKDKFQDINIHISNKVLGKRKGTVEFNIHNSSTGSSSLLDFNPNLSFASKRKLTITNVDKVKVEMTTLDDEVNSRELEKIDYLKIDTQGTELDVLRGAEKLLKLQKIDFIEFEIILTPTYLNMPKWSETLDYLLNLNYHLIALSNDGRFFNLGPYDTLLNPELQIDVIFVSEKVNQILNTRRL